uniref:Uncharacterized protein n=2 Tax=Clytia hemisphaerica TaxID=252671 RepID=A0A7M5WIC9_9CNID
MDTYSTVKPLRGISIVQKAPSWSAKLNQIPATFQKTNEVQDEVPVTFNIENIKGLKLNRSSVIQRYRKRHGFQNDTQKHDTVCKIPNLDPLGPSGMNAWVTKAKQRCNVIKLGKIFNNRLVIEDPGRKISSVTMEYILRGRKRKADGSLHPPEGRASMITDRTYNYHKVLNDDFHVHFSLSQNISFDVNQGSFISSPLEHDFIKVSITQKSGVQKREYYSTISNKTKVCGQHGRKLDSDGQRYGDKSNPQATTTGLPFNIHMFMVDATSKGNAYRQMPRLMEILEEDPDAMVFKAHGIHGDGTTCQIMATLAGYQYNQEDSNPWQPPNKKNCDDIDLIFKDFQKSGYTTLYNEDIVLGGVFHYKMNGFNKPPTDWYPRPYWIAAHEMQGGCGKPPCICEAEEVIQAMKTFTTSCEDEKKFSIQITNNAHDDMNLLFLLEDHLIDIYEFYREKARVDNTILILFGDHGARWGARGNFRNTKQGRLEEFNPFYSIILPPSFKRNYRELYDNIEANQHVLTSHFDVHWTLKHILSYPNVEEKRTAGQSLFTKIDPKARTCKQSGVPQKYCFCMKTTRIDSNSTQAFKIAETVVSFINNKIEEYDIIPKQLCAHLTLTKIISLEYATDEQKNEGIFYIMFEVAPSNATFDVRVRKDLNKRNETYHVDPEISRTNLYRNQPACIQMAYPKLAPYCYCKSQT